MELINLLENTKNKPSKFKTKHWIGINAESRKTYNASNQNKFKTSMIRPRLSDCSDVYIHAREL